MPGENIGGSKYVPLPVTWDGSNTFPVKSDRRKPTNGPLFTAKTRTLSPSLSPITPQNVEASAPALPPTPAILRPQSTLRWCLLPPIVFLISFAVLLSFRWFFRFIHWAFWLRACSTLGSVVFFPHHRLSCSSVVSVMLLKKDLFLLFLWLGCSIVVSAEFFAPLLLPFCSLV